MLRSSSIRGSIRPKDAIQIRKINYRQTKLRWVALVVGCFVLFGQQYCFDNPSALEHTIKENLAEDGDGISSVTFNLLYILYSLPNVVICIFGGMLIDKLKARTVLVITILILTTGQFVFTLGGYRNMFSIMLVGRIIFGVASETLTASENTLISNWFQPAELSLVLGMSISFPKLGSALNNYLSPKLSTLVNEHGTYKNVYIPLAVGLGFALFSTAFAVALFMLDYKTDVKEVAVYQKSIKNSKNSSNNSYVIQKKLKNKKSANTSSLNVRVEETDENLLDNVDKPAEDHAQHISFKDVARLPMTFWLLLVVCMLSQALFIPFLDNGNQYFHIIYDVTPDRAGTYLILPYCICAVLTPIFGIVIDRIAKRAVVIVVSCLTFLLTYGVMMALELIDADIGQGFIPIPLILLGICCAVYSTAIVPSVPMLVDRKLLGTAFGLMEMLQNLALGTFPLIAATIRDASSSQQIGFQNQTRFYFGISILCFVASIALLIRDKATGNKLYRKDFQKEFAETVLQAEFDDMKEDI